MRNLKKLIAVIMVVAMIASLMVPALAAQNEDRAKKLQELGLFKGYSDTELGLDDGLTREQALAFMLRVMGLEDKVQAMDAEEVAEYMGRVVDPETVTATWAHPYVAYAIKYDLTRGVNSKIYPNVEFDGQRVISGKEFIRFILNGLGFTPEVVGWDDVLDKAQEIGLLTASEVVRYGLIQEMTRDEAVYVLESALDATTVDGITLAQALYNAGAVDKETLAKYGYAVEEPTPEPVQLAITAKAVKVNVIEVEFNDEVTPADVTFTVKRGSIAVAVDKVEWASNKVARLTTAAKMATGTYTVEVKVAEDDTAYSAQFDVLDQYVAEIKILNEVALTDDDADRVFVYYDVLDQYGESIRTSTNIEWSFSVQEEKINRSAGVITLKKNDKNDVFMYGEKIYVTGVYARNGVSVTAVLTVGQKQAVDGVEIVGFVKKGTSEIRQDLPAGFKEDEYYLVYKVTDQNGNPIVETIDKPVNKNHITFISDNPMVIKGFTKDDGETILTIDGTEYYAIFVEPGINVSAGGEVTVTAISNRTGNRVERNIAVGEAQILKSFTLLYPSSIIADGESVEIPFVAKDQNGNEIKNFVTIARQSEFNKLTFSSSTGTLRLEEKDDGTAKLVFKDDTEKTRWSDSITTDGIARTASLTAIVVGGETSNLLLHIQDKARPEAIADIEFDKVLVERGRTTLDLSKITFIDQYGRKFDDKGKDNGFFEAAASGKLSGNDFQGYTFAVRATFKGEKGYFDIFEEVEVKEIEGKEVPIWKQINNSENNTGNIEEVVADITSGKKFEFVANGKNDVVSSKTGFSLKFEIVKYKDATKPSAISPAKSYTMTIVDIKAVSGFTVEDLDKIFVETDKSQDETGASGKTLRLGENVDVDIEDTINFTNTDLDEKYQRTVKVKGKYAGQEVTIPKVYLDVESDKFEATGNVIDAVYNGGFSWKDFYDAKTARYLRKDATVTLKVVIKELAKEGEEEEREVVEVVYKDVLASDEYPDIAKIDGDDAVTANPDGTEITIEVNTAASKITILGKEYKFLDQYNTEISKLPTFRVSSIVENKDRYTENNFTVTGNDKNKVKIVGAELGDTFVLTIKVGDVTKNINVTVGADKQAYIEGSNNNYTGKLEPKLKDQMKN